MSLVNTQTGEILYNADEQARMRNEQGVLRAQRLTPEEEAREKQEEAQRLNETRATLQLEKKKESAWTQTKLNILALQGVHKRTSEKKDPKEIDMPVGSISENITKVDPILFERFGEPREFTEDINLIINGFENEKLVLEGNEMQQLNEYGKKYLLGLLIKKHIFEQGFSVSVDTNNQPILRDEKLSTEPKRQEQMKGIQDALRQFQFPSHSRHPLRKNDNSSLIAEYIAATTHVEHPNLIDHRNSLARKVGITTPNISPEQEKTILESTVLTAEEKSFLLAWKDTRNDKTLADVQSQQEDFVKNAQENIDKKTPETHLKELAERPFTKSAQLLAGGAIGAALLYFAYNQLKKKTIWGTISGLIAGLIGGSIMLPLGDKAWKALDWGDSLKNIQEGKPVNREEAKDSPPARLDINIIQPTKDLWGRMRARLASGQEGIEILMSPKVGQDIATTYPVYTMLNSLNPDEINIGGKYASPDTTVSKNTIDTSLNKLATLPNQKAQLNTLLVDTFERYKKTKSYKKNPENLKKSTLNMMLAAIETEDGWFNEVINLVSDIPEKDAAMKVIGQNPKIWGKIPLRDIKSYFLNVPIDPGSEWKANHPIICELINTVPDSVSIMTNYFTARTIEIQDYDETKTLQSFLLKS